MDINNILENLLIGFGVISVSIFIVIVFVIIREIGKIVVVSLFGDIENKFVKRFLPYLIVPFILLFIWFVGFEANLILK